MRKASIFVSVILLALTSIPVVLTAMSGYSITHPNVIGVFKYPTIGACVGAFLIVASYIADRLYPARQS